MKSCAEGARPYKHTLCFLTHKNFLYRLSFTHGIRCVIILIHALSHSYLLLNLNFPLNIHLTETKPYQNLQQSTRCEDANFSSFSRNHFLMAFISFPLSSQILTSYYSKLHLLLLRKSCPHHKPLQSIQNPSPPSRPRGLKLLPSPFPLTHTASPSPYISISPSQCFILSHNFHPIPHSSFCTPQTVPSSLPRLPAILTLWTLQPSEHSPRFYVLQFRTS